MLHGGGGALCVYSLPVLCGREVGFRQVGGRLSLPAASHDTYFVSQQCPNPQPCKDVMIGHNLMMSLHSTLASVVLNSQEKC